MKKIIVYFPYKLRQQTSGSAVRPVKILEAFKELADNNGYEVIAINGESRDREQAISNLYMNVNPKEILFCYMENATIPIWLTDTDHLPRKPLIDVTFLKYLKKNNIPLGVFYRDIYWKFNSLYKVNPLIKPIMQTIFKIELSLYKKYSSIIYLPSLYMNDFVGVKPDMVTDLPPGGVNKLNYNKKTETNLVQAIYVGGINPRYGIYDTLEAFRLINQKSTKIKLIMVCRKEEFSTYSELMEPYSNMDWLEIHHAYGEQLTPLYHRADFGIVPIKCDTYNDFAVAVKLFEYISYGLPVLATNCKAQVNIIEKSKLGLVVPDNAPGIFEGLNTFLDPQIRDHYKENVRNALLMKHLWIHRAEKVFYTLTQKSGK
ncbi:glycosyltransferase [Neobacillus sp. MM2021_6]|uniref:glycosyltransferase n=1 Tax=Bacillaceae TaxID=186817 RepID=UPI0014084863|nr:MULTISPECIES: glycosyltransferase [Bacillaceae]MBO0961640.1 glycosyltransferase [Neobacillus sp. MM2021_6]NHC21250.1 glycosyltransferase [Bacillus sp. MM2020_4]